MDTVSELDAFNRYIDERCGGSLNGHTLEEAVAGFREYQRQLSALREKIRLSEESAESEGTRPLTEERLDAMCDRWSSELESEGKIK